MKIALVSPYDFAVPGGVNNHIEHLRDNFLRLGQEVRIIAPSSRPSSHRLEQMITPIGRAVGVPAAGSVARVTLSLRIAPKIKRLLQEERFDVIHVHEPFAPFLPMQVLRLSDAINVATFHAAKEGGRNRWYLYGRHALKRWFRRLDGKIAVSAPAMRLVSRYFPGYYNIIPNGVDVEHFEREREPFPQYRDGRPNVLFVGRLEKRKGVKYLLQAFAEVKREMPEPRLLIVGPPTRAARGYRHWVAETGLKDVEFVGYVSYDDLARYHHTADVVVAPATGNESQGIVLLEAMAAGRPLVASNIEGYASVVTHGVEGLLVMPKDAHALAGALLDLLADPQKRGEMGEKGRYRAAQFRWERVSQRVLTYYEQLQYESSSEALTE
ncbi:MAG: glycosyltransferase family 4 protein [Dehalococcoidia bacterium]|jgi:phosphatidylinositol alpha-mannosyltransferase